MKKLIVTLVITAFLVVAAAPAFSQQGDPKFAKSLENYLDALWKFYPTSATLAGYNKYNDKLEDLGKGNLEKRNDALDTFNQEFVAKIDKTKLSPEQQSDLEMVIDSIDLELLRHEQLVPWEYNPLYYNEIIVNSIGSLLTREFAPLDARVKSAVERAKAIPGLIKQAKENLKTPAQIYTETAIKQFAGILDFYKNEVPKLSENKLQAEVAKLIPVLEDYQKFLQNELLPKSTGNFRLAEGHQRLLRLTAQVNIPFEEISARAKADSNNVRREMGIVSLGLFRLMYPKVNMEQMSTQMNEEQFRTNLIKGVLDKLRAEHAGKDEFVNQVKAAADKVKAFIQQGQLLNLPSDNVTLDSMPAFMKSGLLAKVIYPGAYETSGSYKVLLSTLPEELSAEQAQGLMEEFNNYFLPFWAARHVFPGNIVPVAMTGKDPSVIKKMYPNQLLLLGWPVFMGEMLMNNGYENYDMKSRMLQLKQLLQVVIDYQLDLNIHQGGLTKEQAVSIMTQTGFQTPAEAERKWNQILLNPGFSAYAYIGYQELLDIEKEVKKIKGDAYIQKEFLQKALSYGPISFRQLKAKITQ